MARALPRSFYARGAEVVARDLLGKVLEREIGGVVRRARIVETEAYVGPHDLAAHSSKGRTTRNEAMWGPPGHAYVYFIYGLFWMLNVVCSKPGDPQAVLLRAAEPLDRWDIRLNGPALLAKAFGVTRADNGADLTRAAGVGRSRAVRGEVGGPLRILDGPAPTDVHVDRRVGVDYAGAWAHAELRFMVAGSVHVSRKPQVPAKPRGRTAGATSSGLGPGKGRIHRRTDRSQVRDGGKPARQRPHPPGFS